MRVFIDYIQYSVWNPMTHNLKKLNSEQFMNSKVDVLGKRAIFEKCSCARKRSLTFIVSIHVFIVISAKL